MTKPLVVSIPHKLGKDEAIRRVKAGLSTTHTKFSHLIAVEEEIWTDDQVAFAVRAVGQTASGTIEFGEEVVCLKVELPWLLARLAEAIQKAVQKEGTLLLENK